MKSWLAMLTSSGAVILDRSIDAFTPRYQTESGLTREDLPEAGSKSSLCRILPSLPLSARTTTISYHKIPEDNITAVPYTGVK